MYIFQDYFFITEKPTPVVFFEKFDYKSKKVGISAWCSALNASLKILKDDQKLRQLERNYKSGHYTEAMNNYFKKSQSKYLLEKEKASIDKRLTKKTGKAIRNRIDDLLNDKVNSKKPRLAESAVNSSTADPRINEINCGTDGGDAEQFDARILLTNAKKRYQVLYSWKNVIDRTDIREESKKDWIINNYNLSSEFRNFQLSTIQEIEKNPFLSKTDLHKILCLSNIMLIEQTKPQYLTCTKIVWNQICRRQVNPSLPTVILDMILEYSRLLNALTPLDDIQKIWGKNYSKMRELSKQDDIDKFCGSQTILRNYLLLSFKINNNNEDTFVHDMLHDLLKEIFRDPNFELVWANSESTSSKIRRCNNKENSRGKKPDFKLLINTNDEILFGEVKPPKYKNSSLLVHQDLAKLANFQSGALDELVKNYGNRIGTASFGVWVCGIQIHIYQMDLDYDGLYRMYSVADVTIPTQKSQFINLVPVLEALYNVKDSVSKVLEVITSNTSPNPFRSDYCRLPAPSPEPVKVTIVGTSNRK